nr:hypothetical protein CFP56_51907 [Quercus suber]
MEGGSMEEGPKRKLLPPLGETDPNRVQDKRAKIDIDEVALVDRRDYGCIRARLDRVVATTEWSGIFPRARLYHRANSSSDHCILLLKLKQNTRQTKGKKLFHFESVWLKHKQCGVVVQEACEIGIHMARENTLEHCLEHCRIALSTWNSQVFGHVGKNIEHIQGKLQSLEAQVVGLSKQEQIRETRMELNILYAMEEDMWHQRSQSNWAKSGDKNTRYFHEKASSRK